MVNHSTMPKKIVAFLGSPRPHGNTDSLAESVLKGAREAGLESESFALRAMKIHPCTGCEHCWEGGKRCIFQDDGEVLYDALAACDVFLFATPVYWYGPTTYMKTLLDRLVVFNRPEGRPLVKGKSALLVSAWEEKGMTAAEPLVRAFELGFRYLELKFEGSLLLDELGPKNAAFHRPGALESARALGRSLAG